MASYQELKKLDEESLQKLREGSGPSDECICNLLSSPDSEKKSLGASLMTALGITKKKKTINDKQKTMNTPLITGWKGALRSKVTPFKAGGKRTKETPFKTGALRTKEALFKTGALRRKEAPFKTDALRRKEAPFKTGTLRSNEAPFQTGLQSTKEVVRRKSSCGKCGCDDNPTVLRHSYANIRITSPDLSSVCPCSSDCLPEKARLKNNIQVIVEHAQPTSTQDSALKIQSAQHLTQSELRLGSRNSDKHF